MQETWVQSLGGGRSPGEANGNPLQYSCLENPMDGEAWWATVHGVAKSWTQLSDFTFTFLLLFTIKLMKDQLKPSSVLISISLLVLYIWICTSVCVCVPMCEHPHGWFVLCQLFTSFSYFYCSVFLLMALNSFAHLFTHSFFQQWLTKIYYVLILLRIVKFCLLCCKMFFLVHSLPFNFVYGRLWCIEILNFYALILFLIFCNMLRNSFSILRESFIIWIEKPCFKKSLRSEIKKYIYI